MELKIANTKKKIELSDDVFACEFNPSLVHQIVTAYMNAGRAGTKAQKTRAEVRGGGVKPWRQKGTGQARAGTITSPIWRTGGRTFAAKPRCYKQKVNKKMHKGAIRSILSELIRQDRIQIVDKFEVSSNKTKDLVKKLTDMKVEGHIMIIADDVQENLYLAARNLHRIALSDASATVTDPVSLVRAEKVIATETAMKELEELLK